MGQRLIAASVPADIGTPRAPATGSGSRLIGVAVAIPEPWGAELQEWRRRFGDPMADAIPAHVTLLPPTRVWRHEIDGVSDHLRTAAAKFDAFSVRLRGTGTFRPISPVVYVALADGAERFADLAAAVRGGPLEHQLEFPYHPHVTVAHHLDDPTLDGAFEVLADYDAVFEVAAFHLYEHGTDGVWRPEQAFTLNPR